MAADSFTDEDIQHLLATAEEQGLPPVSGALVFDGFVLLYVADAAAVTEWAERLERPTYMARGEIRVEFSRGDYTVRVTSAAV